VQPWAVTIRRTQVDPSCAPTTAGLAARGRARQSPRGRRSAAAALSLRSRCGVRPDSKPPRATVPA